MNAYQIITKDLCVYTIYAESMHQASQEIRSITSELIISITQLNTYQK